MRVESYFSPAAAGESEVVEKRSRFIGHVVPADSEDKAREAISRARSRYHDARHHCWCYIIRGVAERYSDDGEPQGTAGLPMLEVFRRGGIVDFCCVVTRYFGGTLLGAGGLSRAYGEAAKQALEDSGLAEFRLYECMSITCAYNLLGAIKSDIEQAGGIAESVEYGENVLFSVIVPDGYAQTLNKRLADTSAGAVTGVVTGRKWSPNSFSRYK